METISSQLDACVSLIAHPDNLVTTIAFGAYFILSTVFVFINKSMPVFVKDLTKGIVNALGKK